MNAVIVELRGKKAAALLDDGTVVIIANSDYAIGQQIPYTHQSRRPGNAMRTARKVSAWAAGIAAVLCLGAGAYVYQTPYSYVSVDVNPSIQFTLNRYDQVLKVTAVNRDAEPIAEALGKQDIAHKSIQNAVEITIEDLAARGYFEDGGYLLFAAASKNEKKAEKLADSLTQTAHDAGPETLTVKALIGELVQVKISNQEGISLGRQALFEQLKSCTNSAQPFSNDEWLNKSVKELIGLTEQPATQFGDDQHASSSNASTQTPQQYSEETGNKQELTQPETTITPSPGQSGGSSGSQPKHSSPPIPEPSPSPTVTASPKATGGGVPEGSHRGTTKGKS